MASAAKKPRLYGVVRLRGELRMFGGTRQELTEWDRLDSQFRTPLRAYFARRVGDRGEAEDLTQEVFLRLARHPDRHQGETIAAYIFKIASSVLQDWRRYQISRRAGAHDVLPENAEINGVSRVLVEMCTPERVVAARQSLRDLEMSLSELSDRTREIFILSRLENVQHRDIAALHGISISAVEKHVVKAIAHLSARAFEH